MRGKWQGPAVAVCLSLGLLLGHAAAALAADPIGKVRSLAGNARIQRDGATIAPAMGDPVFQQDVLVTGSDGSMGVILVDDTALSMGPDTELVLSDYAFDSSAYEGRMTADMRQGTLAVTSGEIPKASPGAMVIRTNKLILGVRGTTLLVSAE